MTNHADIIYYMNAVLYNIIQLKTCVKMVHWNYRGENFWQIHKMTDDFYGDLVDFEDKVGEETRKYDASVSLYIMDNEKIVDPSNYEIEQMSNYEKPDYRFLLDNLVFDYKNLENMTTYLISLMNDSKYEGTKNVLADFQGTLNKHIWFLTSILK